MIFVDKSHLGQISFSFSYKYMWFSLVTLFNCISTFMNYLMPKPSLFKNSSGTIWSKAGGDKGFMPFLRVLVWKWI